MSKNKQITILESMLKNIEEDINKTLKLKSTYFNDTITVELIGFYAKTMEKYLNLIDE
jgi:hypothetical protein